MADVGALKFNGADVHAVTFNGSPVQQLNYNDLHWSAGPYINVSSDYLFVCDPSMYYDITVLSNESWTLDIPPGCSWVTFAPATSGVRIQCSSNTGDVRICEVIFHTTNAGTLAQKKVTVILNHDGDDSLLYIDPSSVELNNTACGSTTILSNKPWLATVINPKWFTVNPSFGEDGKTSIESEVPTGEVIERQGSFRVLLASDGKYIDVTVELLISEVYLESSASDNPVIIPSSAGGSANIQIFSNSPWEVSSDETWCTCDNTSGRGSCWTTIRAEAYENPLMDRTATLTITSTSQYCTNTSIDITVIQRAHV